MLQTYFDESEPEDFPVLTIAGYVSTQNLWRQFEIHWNEMLREFGIETYFHMADFIANKREFAGWEKEPEKRARCISRAISLIREYTHMRVSCTIALPDYEAVVKPAEPDNPNIARAFTLCGTAAMASVAHWTKNRGLTEKIAYVFEQGHRHAGQIDTAFNQSKKVARVLRTMYRLGSVSRAFKEDAVMLQAADILAHQTARFAADNATGRKSPETYLRELHELPFGVAWMHNPESLQQCCNDAFDIATARKFRGYRRELLIQ
jgi:hypothetical protein